MSDLSDALMSTPSAVTAGWSQLGRVLGGGGQASANAYQRGAMQGASVADVMEQARRRRDQNMGFEDITPDTVKAALAGDPTAQASLIAAQAHAGGGNADELAKGLQTGQNTGFIGAMMRQAQGGASISKLNPQLAVLGGKVVDTSKIEGNTIFDPTVAPNEQAGMGGNVPTAIGQSDIGLHMAQAGAAKAAAGEHNAQAQRALAGIGADKAANYDVVTMADGSTAEVNKLTHQVIPVTDASGKPVSLAAKGAGASGSALRPEEIEEALGKPPVGGKSNPDYVAFKNFQSLHAKADPSFNNDRTALAAYLQAKQGTEMAAKYATNAPQVDDEGNPVITPLASSLGAALKSAGNRPAPEKENNEGDLIHNGGDRASGLSMSDLITGKGASPSTPPAHVPAITAGQTATNPKTGQKIQWNGSAWVPVNG